MSLYLYRLRYSIRVLHHLIWEEFEERNQMEEDREDPSEERDVATTSCYYSHLIKLSNDVIIRGGLICPPLMWWCLLISL